MSLSRKALEELRDHWAINTFETSEIDRAMNFANQCLAVRGIGKQIDFSFEETKDDESLLKRVALAFELAAIEGLDELTRPAGKNAVLRKQAVAASHRAFGLNRHLPVPTETLERLFFVLHLSATAYCGDSWSDLRRWYREQKEITSSPSVVNVRWDRRLLYRIFDCWTRLFLKDGWDDLDRVREIIAGLRNDQKIYEKKFLDNTSKEKNRAIAFRLAALYNWAKATETLAVYTLQGEPVNPFGIIDKHFEAAIKAATVSKDAQHEIILRWLHATSYIMVTNSLWWATRTINSQTKKFVRNLTHREHRAMFELLPPQRAALLEQGLLDQAKTAIVVDLPTSGGKTLLAQFRILQALNQFQADQGWVVYVAPTRALSAQITRHLRADFEPIGLRVEQLTAAIEIDTFENELLENNENPFNILVATPEKLSLVIRNKRVNRPLALVVMDEAHNLETESRGLRIELLLATIKRDCPRANFLLLMPYVEGTDSIVQWLAHNNEAGNTISLGTVPWKPNERIVGIYRAVANDSVRGGWHLNFETLTKTEKAMPLKGIHQVGKVKPIDVPKSKVLTKNTQKGLWLQTAAIGTTLSALGTSITVTNNITTVWKMASAAAQSLKKLDKLPRDIRLVQDFLRTEYSSDFKLIDMLDKGVGVHHAGLSDDVRTLMEWLAEAGKLRVLCATSTIAQGINFPVSSVLLSSRHVWSGKTQKEFEPREFWNLAGRAGRINHDSIGVVGISEGRDRQAIIDFVSRSTGALISRLVVLIDDLTKKGQLNNLSNVLWQDQWEDFRCYIAHLWAEKKNLDAVLAESEQILRHTYGYTLLRSDPSQQAKADALLEATRCYANELAQKPEKFVNLADSTGFSPEGVQAAEKGIYNLESKLTASDWAPESLFGNGGRMADLFGVMLKVPQLKQNLNEISEKGLGQRQISEITKDWVNGKSLKSIANKFFTNQKDDESGTAALTDACRAIYRTIVNSGTWGVSALSQLSGIKFEELSEADRRRINVLPAMIYHGVSSEDAALMRMNSAPRSAAKALGELYRQLNDGNEDRFSVGKARHFLEKLNSDDWNKARPENAALSGNDYKRVWEILSGKEN